MKRYNIKASESFKTKLEIYLFSKAIRDEIDITINDFKAFKIENEDLAKYERYWQLEKNERIGEKKVEAIETKIEEMRLNNSDKIKSLRNIYIKEFESVFPKKEFEKLVSQKICSYCELSIDEFKDFRNQGLIRKKHLTRGWSKLEIDRKYPNKEYTKANTVMSCYWCNNAKTDEFTSEEFEKIGSSIRNVWLKRLKNKKILIKEFQNNLAFAKQMDEKDELKSFRSQFHLPMQKNGKPYIYLCGNSLGLQPKSTKANLEQELLDWKNLGVEGHFHAKNPWLPYHEFLTEFMAKVVGAKPEEVVVMNTLTVNLHLMMVSFYQPKGKRNKILIEADAFPSDKYAVESQIKFHGFSPKDCLIELKAREGEVCLREADILEVIDTQGDEIALILLGNTNYYTGQYFDMKTISQHGHAKGAMVGFDCAHGAGNMPLNLHDSGCDFAVWCNYKYLNAGPGSLGGAFIHKRHIHDKDLPRFEGWWGHNKETRFKMRGAFDPTPTIEAWQLSNPPILSMVAVWSSLKLFESAGMARLRRKAISLTGYLEYLVQTLGDEVINIITPSDPTQRGSQLSIQVKNSDKTLFNQITERGVMADWREPDVIRVAPVAMYNSYEDVYLFYEILKNALNEKR